MSCVLLTGLLVLARWAWTLFGGDPPTGLLGYFTWAAYLVAGLIVVSILGSCAAGVSFLVHRALHSEEITREARKVKADAHHFYVDAAGGKGPYELSAIRLVPSLALVDVEFRAVREPVSEARLSAMRAMVNDAVARIRRDAAPETWVDALPGALTHLREHDLVLRGPSGAFHWYDPQEVPGKVG